MSLLVNGRAVPVIWSPSDLHGGDSDGHVGRGRQIIRALVYHRIVGTLETTVNQTFYPTTDDLMTKGERRVSSQFSLGHWGSTGLRVVQHVALENTAYCNGQTERDRAVCTWGTWIRAGRPDPNEMTVSFEHEDNAAAGDYIVQEDVIQLSIALSRLLLSGDPAAIRAAGIRCSDAAAAQLGRIVPSRETLVPHRTIAPVTKPYCWMPYRLDKGFPQARYIAALTAPKPTEEPMGLAVRLFATADATARSTAFGTAKVEGPGHALIRVSDMAIEPVADGLDLGVVQKGELVDGDLEAQRGKPHVAGDRTSIVALNYAGEQHVALLMDVAFTAFKPVVDRSAAALEDARSAVTIAAGKAVDQVAANYTEVVPHG